MKKTIQWALVGTGGITNAFARGLKAAQGVNASAVVSRDRGRALSFAATYAIPKVYDNYDMMLDDAEIDVVYIGVPHSAHKALALRAFKAGKAVLCEKPAAINAGELAEMITCAREHKVFFMEAMWARFVPPVVKARQWLDDGLAGEVRMVQANFGFKIAVMPEHRLWNRELGGGALLDAGVYPISFASMAFGGAKPQKICGTLSLGETGIDDQSAALLSWGPHKTALVSCALSLPTVNDAWIYGTEGTIHLPSFVFCHSANLEIPGRPPYHWEGDFRGNGYNYEAEAVAECLREGRLECALMPLDESLNIAATMDEIRAQCGFAYPGENS